MTQTIAMRCLSGPQVGMGHLVRCRELARHLKTRGYSAVIMGPAFNLQSAEDRTLFTAWKPEIAPFDAENDCDIFLQFCAEHNARHANMDDYRIAPDYQKKLRAAGIRTLQQFDASKPWPFWADFIVNAGPSERPEDYTNLIQNAGTQTLFGPRYAVLRPAFTKLKHRANGRPIKRLMICFGGGDDNGLLRRITTGLASTFHTQIKLIVVCPTTNPAIHAYQAELSNLPSVHFLIDPPNMAHVMQSCDAAIIAGGTMSYEAAICGLPIILTAIAANQERACKGWQTLADAIYLGQAGEVHTVDVISAVEMLKADVSKRTRMAIKGRAAVDGRGTNRLIDALLGSPER